MIHFKRQLGPLFKSKLIWGRCNHRGLLQFFLSLDYSKKPQGRNLKCQIFIQHFFKIVLYWCLDLIRHNIGTHLKLNKYIFDISIPFCHHLYLSATLKQCFTKFAVCRITFHHVDVSTNSYMRFDWLVIFRVRIAKNVLIFKPDLKKNRPIKSHIGIQPL
jgi:hypothetical protein